MSTYRLTLQIISGTVTTRIANAFFEADFALSGKRLSKIKTLSERLAQGEKGLSVLELQELGENLFSALFNGVILDKFKELYAKISDSIDTSLRLELIFSDNAADAAQLPWEFMRVPPAHQIANLEPFLAVTGKVALVRNVFNAPIGTLRRIAPSEKLRVGVAVSKPQFWGSLPNELGPIDEQPVIDFLSAQQAKAETLFSIEYRPTVASKSSIRTLLSDYEPHILHFIGHGDVIENDEAVLILIDDETVNWEALHSALPVNGQQMSSLFDGQQKPMVVILQSCNTAKSGSPDAHSNMAAQLAKAGIPLVVAMQYEIQNKTATEFGKRLYDALALGETIEAAVNKARLYLYDLAVDRGFGTPVIYVTTDEGELFSRTKEEAILDALAVELLELPGFEKIPSSVISKIYISSIYKEITLLDPLTGSNGGVRRWVFHLAQATPLPGKSRPLAYFAATLADRIMYSQAALAASIQSWIVQNATELMVDPDKTESLILVDEEQVDPPYLLVDLKPYLNQLNLDPKHQQYVLTILDGRQQQPISSDENLKFLDLPKKILYALNEIKLTSEEVANKYDLLWIEFCLPTSYLSSKVEQWPTLEGKKLGQAYKVVVRSHYRQSKRTSSNLQKSWTVNWNACHEALKNAPTIIGGKVITEAKDDAISAAIKDVQVLGLTFEPCDNPPNCTVMTILLDSGIPIALWVRQGADTEMARKWLNEQIVEKLDLRHLADNVRTERNRDDSELGKNLVLLWDNYDHTLDIDASFEAPTFQEDDVPF